MIKSDMELINEEELNSMLYCLLNSHECNCGNETTDREVKEIRGKIYQILDNQWKSTRYDNLRDSYLDQNSKHFDELCGEYFDD